MVGDRRLLYVLQRASRTAVAHANGRTIERVGVPVMQLGALSHLENHPGASVDDLAAVFDASRSVAADLVLRLVRGGLVRQEQNPENRKNPLLFLTRDGETVRASSVLASRHVMEELSDGFTGPEIDVVLRFLNAIVHKFSADRGRPGRDVVLRAGSLALRQRLERVLDHIDENLGRKLTLEDLAEVFGASVSHFKTTFRRAIRVSVHRYVVRRRVQRARELLVQGTPIATVATETGFTDPSHLARWMRRELGVTPSHFGGERLPGRKPDTR